MNERNKKERIKKAKKEAKQLGLEGSIRRRRSKRENPGKEKKPTARQKFSAFISFFFFFFFYSQTCCTNDVVTVTYAKYRKTSFSPVALVRNHTARWR